LDELKHLALSIQPKKDLAIPQRFDFALDFQLLNCQITQLRNLFTFL